MVSKELVAASSKPMILAILARVVKRPANLGVREGKLAPCPNSPNCVSTYAEDEQHSIDPITYDGSAEDAKARLLTVIEGMPRTEIVEDNASDSHWYSDER